MKKAEDILKMKRPEQLFTGDVKTLKTEYQALFKKFHPDFNVVNKDYFHKVMAHINNLYKEAEELLEIGNWVTPNTIKMSCKDGSVRTIKYLTTHKFELGDMYIANTLVLYLIPNKHKEFFDNAITRIKNFKYSSDKMKEEISRYLPTITSTFEIDDGNLGIIISKTEDLLLLKDVFAYYKGNVPDKHVAWILNTIYNISCYLDYAGLSHNAITLDNYFISPKYHSGVLLGGWWYSVPQNSKLIGMPTNIYSIMPLKVKDNKVGNILTDLESIKAIGRELLGDRNGIKIPTAVSIQLVNWLKFASSGKANDNYTKWNEVLESVFGKRKFIEMNLTANMLYN